MLTETLTVSPPPKMKLNQDANSAVSYPKADHLLSSPTLSKAACSPAS